tara:strand:+ start:264 stop:1793 length:1530 start_codon:yes stop_codon:yes gene_type:complete
VSYAPESDIATPMQHKKKSLIQSVKWAYLMNWCQQGGSAAFSILLAAILGPEAFGTVVIATVFTMFVDMFLDQGFVAAIIQRKELRRDHLDSVFWTLLAASLLLFGGSIAASGWWARVNDLPILESLICVLALRLPLGALSRVQQAKMFRDSEFKQLSIRNTLSILIGGGIGLYMAAAGYGVWALVGQQLGSDLVSLILLWIFCDWKPGFRFSVRGVKDLFGFSSANFLAKLGVFANQQADTVIIGFFFGPMAVGLYRFAGRAASLVKQVLTSSLQTASLPELSRLQDEPKAFSTASIKFLRLSTLLAIPTFVCLGVLSQEVFSIVGDEWLPAAKVFTILCICGAISSINQFTGPILQALGRPMIMAKITWALAPFSVAILVVVATLIQDYPIETQTVGLAWVKVALGLLLSLPIFVIVSRKYAHLSGAEILAAHGPATSAALAGGIVAFVFQQGLHYYALESLVILVIAGVASALTAASVAFATEPLARHSMQARFLATRKAFQRFYR